jgi:hypothetical protein
MDGVVEILFPDDHRQSFYTTEVVVLSEKVITCCLRSSDSGNDGDRMSDPLWPVFHSIFGAQSLCSGDESTEHCCHCPWSVAVCVVFL